MLTVYGALMPLRLLEEIRFWKMQEKEHTLVIRELTPRLEPEYVRLLAEWEPVFAWTESEAQRWIDAVLKSPAGVTPYIQMQIEKLLNVSVEQSNVFVRQLQLLTAQSSAVSANPTAKTVIHHIIRESDYFLGVLQTFMAGGSAFRQPEGLTPKGTDSLPERREAGVDSSYVLGASKLAQSFASATFLPLKLSMRRQEEEEKHKEKAQLHVIPEPLPREPVHPPKPSAEQTATGEGIWTSSLDPDRKPVPIGGHVLPPLPYAYDALLPHIDAETMKLHHDMHHQSYVDGLNRAEKKLAEARGTGDYTLIKHWEREAAFHGAGHYLHTLFWKVMTPRGGGKPADTLAAQLEQDYGSFESFKRHFSEAADKVEGGGWALLVWSPRSHRTQILQAEKHQNLTQWESIPLLVLDVWEHAYYIRYRNSRVSYIEAWWNVVNWPYVNVRLDAARRLQWTPA